MIEIEPAALGALEADIERRRLGRFLHWWSAQALPPADEDRLRDLWHYAARQAHTIGIDDDEQGRITLYAAAIGLMGDADGHVFLRVADILFLDEPVEHRFARIAALARGGAGA